MEIYTCQCVAGYVSYEGKADTASIYTKKNPGQGSFFFVFLSDEHRSVIACTTSSDFFQDSGTATSFSNWLFQFCGFLKKFQSVEYMVCWEKASRRSV